jgi:ABC-type multidrug transport system ATPase subunit
MQEIVSKLQILIIATHDLNKARTLCNRGVILSHGNLVADMEIGEACPLITLQQLPRGSMRHLNLLLNLRENRGSPRLGSRADVLSGPRQQGPDAYDEVS